MADPMRIRAKMAGDKIDVRILMSHPMESGLRKDGDGNVVPASYIVKVSATWQGKEVLAADWAVGIEKSLSGFSL